MRAVAVLSLVLALASGMAWGGAEAAPLEHCVKAEAAYQAGDHALEIEYYTRCIDDEGPASATRAIAHNNRGVAHLAAGDPDSAIADYEKALSLDSAYAMAYANRGMAQLAKGNFVQSLRDYDTALDFDPAYAPAYTNRCWLFGFMGYGEAALEDCDESLRLRPDDSFTLDARAFAFWLLEDQEKARQDLQLAQRLDPSRPIWYERFAEFERIYSVGYPYATAAVQSADRQAEADQATALQAPSGSTARPH